MKLRELKNEEWTGEFQVVVTTMDLKVLLLELKLSGWKNNGRQNLLAVDKTDNIIWISPPPSFGYQLNCFMNFHFENHKLTGWYGGSIYLEVDIQTGEIVKEQFIK